MEAWRKNDEVESKAIVARSMPEASTLRSFQLLDIRYASLSMSQLGKEIGRARLNHAGRHRFITTAKGMLFTEVALALSMLSSLYSKHRLENAPPSSPRYRSL